MHLSRAGRRRNECVRRPRPERDAVPRGHRCAAVRCAAVDVRAAAACSRPPRRCAGADLHPRCRGFSRRPRPGRSANLLAKVTQAANLFHAVGVRANDVVAYALPNLPQTHFALWGAEAAGIAMAINPALPGEQAADLLRAAERARARHHDAHRLRPTCSLRSRPTSTPCPSLTHVFVVGDGPVPVLPGLSVMKFGKAMDLQRSDALASGRSIARRRSVVVVLHRRHHRRAEDRAPHARQRSQPMRDMICDRARGSRRTGPQLLLRTAALPRQRGDGHRARAVARRVARRARARRPATATRTLIANFWAARRGAPNQRVLRRADDLRHAAADSRSKDYDLALARLRRSAARRRCRSSCSSASSAATGIRILEAYGLTESACVASLNPIDGERRVGSIGQALPGQKMKAVILDESGTLRSRRRGRRGRRHRALPAPTSSRATTATRTTPAIVDRLRRRTSAGSTPATSAGRTRDGYFWLTGRKKQLIIRGGHNIDPATIEEPLHRHPDVALAAAVGRPDAHAGEVPVAYVQLRARRHGRRGRAARVRRRGRSASAPPCRRPSASCAQIPVTAVGKIFKPALVAARGRGRRARGGGRCWRRRRRDRRHAPTQRRGLVARVRTRGMADALAAGARPLRVRGRHQRGMTLASKQSQRRSSERAGYRHRRRPRTKRVTHINFSRGRSTIMQQQPTTTDRSGAFMRRAAALAIAALLARCRRGAGVRDRHRQSGHRRCAGTTRSATTSACARRRRTAQILGSPNFDDGDRNFGNGSLVTNRLDVLSEFDFVCKRKIRLPRQRAPAGTTPPTAASTTRTTRRPTRWSTACRSRAR